MSLSEKNLHDFGEKLEAAFAEIDSDICTDLYHNDCEYISLRKEVKHLQKVYPNIVKLMEREGAINLSEEEHSAFVEYTDVISRMENMERQQIYFRGHADGIDYLKKIGVL